MGDDETHRAIVVRTHERLERAIRNQPPGTTVCLPIEPVPVATGFPGVGGLFVPFHPTDDVDGRHV